MSWSAGLGLEPALSPWTGAVLTWGNIPVFDDVDFIRLHAYLDTNAAALRASLGPKDLAELRHVAGHLEQAVDIWKSSEPRIWGKLISGIYRLFTWMPDSERMNKAVKGADGAAESFLNRATDSAGVERPCSSQRSMALRTYLSNGQVQDALHHLGAHMVLSVTLVVPIPGLRSAARAGWTLYFLARTQLNRLFHKGEPADRTAGNIHTPLVALISLVPLFGGAAYLACKPLRRKVLIRLALDQMASVLPFRAYERFRLQRWLAPPVLQNGDSGEDCVLDG